MSQLSAVLPLNIAEDHKSNSCALVDVLLASIRKFAAPELFKDFFIFCPLPQVEIVKSHLHKYDDLPITVLNELDVLPELAKFPDVGGWRIQQMLKLAAANLVTTPYYITFDADVVCTHPINENNLLPGGKGLIQLEAKAHHNWWRSSAHQLATAPNLTQPGIYVTPVVMAAEPIPELIRELSAKEHWTAKLLNPHKKYALQKMLPQFKRKHRWSEYTLYYLFLEKHGLVDQYHLAPGSDGVTHTLVSDHSVWKRIDFDQWDEALCFSEADKSLFVIIQSNKKIAPDVVWERLQPYLEPR